MEILGNQKKNKEIGKEEVMRLKDKICGKLQKLFCKILTNQL